MTESVKINELKNQLKDAKDLAIARDEEIKELERVVINKNATIQAMSGKLNLLAQELNDSQDDAEDTQCRITELCDQLAVKNHTIIYQAQKLASV